MNNLNEFSNFFVPSFIWLPILPMNIYYSTRLTEVIFYLVAKPFQAKCSKLFASIKKFIFIRYNEHLLNKFYFQLG